MLLTPPRAAALSSSAIAPVAAAVVTSATRVDVASQGAATDGASPTAGGGKDAAAAAEGRSFLGTCDLPFRTARQLRAIWIAEGGGRREIPISVHADYAKRFGCGGVGLLVAVGLFGASQASLVLYDCFLARWSGLPDSEQEDVTSNLGGLAMLAGLAALLVGGQAGLWAVLSLRASSSMHAAAISQVLRAPLLFSLATERGRILTRLYTPPPEPEPDTLQLRSSVSRLVSRCDPLVLCVPRVCAAQL